MSSNRGIKQANTGAEKVYGDVKHVQDLPEDLFQICLDFVGKGNFAFVAPVSKHFYWQYINLGVDYTVSNADTSLQQGQNKRTAAKIVGNGSLRLATECFLKAPHEFQDKVCQQAAVNGRVDILDCAVSLGVDMRCIFRRFCRYGERFLIEALENGHLNVIEFLSTEGVDFDAYYSLKSELQNGNANKLHWMITKELIEVDKEEMAACLARDGELEILKEHYKDSITKNAFDECVKGGHVDVMEWILQICNYEIDPSLFVDAVESGSIPMMEICLGHVQNDIPFHVNGILFPGSIKYVLQASKEKGKTLNILNWLQEQNFAFTSFICEILAEHGTVEGLKWAREKGYDWDQSTFESAVSSGDIATLEYCLKNDCPSPSPSDLFDSFKGYKWHRITDQEALAVYMSK